MTIQIIKRPLKILHFDTESRPLAWIGQDFVTSEITAIGCGWNDIDDIHAWYIPHHSKSHMHGMFEYFWRKADIVTGHYIIKHDLPRINADRWEIGLPTLPPKDVVDTCTMLHKMQGISKSQENLAEELGIEEGKHHMSNSKWRKSNRLLPEGLENARKRVVDDVVQHKALYDKLQQRGNLKTAKTWRG